MYDEGIPQYNGHDEVVRQDYDRLAVIFTCFLLWRDGWYRQRGGMAFLQ